MPKDIDEWVLFIVVILSFAAIMSRPDFSTIALAIAVILTVMECVVTRKTSETLFFALISFRKLVESLTERDAK